MKLFNLPFNTTSGLRNFSDLVSKAVQDVNQQLSIAINQESLPMPQGSQGEDSLNYWGKEPKDSINFGRYLNYTNKDGIPVEFWIGLDITKSKVRFIIWFDKQKYQSPLTEALEKISEGAPALSEAWKSLDDTSFEEFCQTSDPQILSTFIVNVLKNL